MRTRRNAVCDVLRDLVAVRPRQLRLQESQEVRFENGHGEVLVAARLHDLHRCDASLARARLPGRLPNHAEGALPDDLVQAEPLVPDDQVLGVTRLAPIGTRTTVDLPVPGARRLHDGAPKARICLGRGAAHHVPARPASHHATSRVPRWRAWPALPIHQLEVGKGLLSGALAVEQVEGLARRAEDHAEVLGAEHDTLVEALHSRRHRVQAGVEQPHPAEEAVTILRIAQAIRLVDGPRHVLVLRM
mmetsp:Transcript_77405/g.205480  ORF Transcript_77405/g.205480 Transcript_77405/m.205480 type:complete len:246 (-) Transcript_77405:459-1196(-)